MILNAIDCLRIGSFLNPNRALLGRSQGPRETGKSRERPVQTVPWGSEPRQHACYGEAGAPRFLRLPVSFGHGENRKVLLGFMNC